MKTKGSFSYKDSAYEAVYSILTCCPDQTATTFTLWKLNKNNGSKISKPTMKRILESMKHKEMVACISLGKSNFWKALPKKQPLA